MVEGRKHVVEGPELPETTQRASATIAGATIAGATIAVSQTQDLGIGDVSFVTVGRMWGGERTVERVLLATRGVNS